MKQMFLHSQRHERIHVQQVLHGKSASISRTSSLVRTGASAGPLRTGRPVRGSLTIFARRECFLRGVNTTLAPSILASSASPGRRPSLRRILLGSTTCPFVEIRVCMVRRSYHRSPLESERSYLRKSRRRSSWRNAIKTAAAIQWPSAGSEAEMYAAAIAVVIFAALLFSYLYIIRPWHLHWGATHLDRIAVLPGDALSPYATAVVTHAVNIDAPAEAAWRWLVQLGQDRGGFYSYSFLENLVGCDMHNTFRIVPEWQQRTIGD